VTFRTQKVEILMKCHGFSAFSHQHPDIQTHAFTVKNQIFSPKCIFFENEAKNQKSLLAHFYIHATNEAHQF